MFHSTVIPTIGRPTLSRAIESVLNQGFTRDDFEVIVANDSGQPLPEAEWQRSERVQIVNTNRRDRSVARNAGAAVAKGKYLHFLDDDDWMLPGAFEHFWKLANTAQAAWLYGGFRLVDNTGQTIKEIYPDEAGNCYIKLLASEWIPLQASLIEARAFFAVGGFAPLQSLLGGYEDIDLSRQVGRYHDVAGTFRLVASIRAGDRDSTTDYFNMFNQNRQSREKALNTRGAFTRLRASAHGSTTNPSYWYGRIIYYYLASLKWSLEHKRLFTAASRGTYAAAGLGAAGRYLLSASFWRGVLHPHSNQVRTSLEQSDIDANMIWRRQRGSESGKRG